MLSLVHVRLPPGFSASASPQRPTNVHMAHYNKGRDSLVSRLVQNVFYIYQMYKRGEKIKYFSPKFLKHDERELFKFVLRILATFEAKIAKIGNFWTF